MNLKVEHDNPLRPINEKKFILLSNIKDIQQLKKAESPCIILSQQHVIILKENNMNRIRKEFNYLKILKYSL